MTDSVSPNITNESGFIVNPRHLGMPAPINFEEWMRDIMEFGKGTIDSRLSNLKKIEECYGDLKQLWNKDGLSGLLDELTYSHNDFEQGRQPKHRITISGNLFNGTATYKTTAKLYKKYLDSMYAQGAVSSHFNAIEKILIDVLDRLSSSVVEQEKYCQNDVKKLIVDPLLTLLNTRLSPYGYWFQKEVGIDNSQARDRYDIQGVSEKGPVIIIEIDTHRADQVSKKLLSRLALNLDAELIYVSLVYGNNHVNREAEIKETNKYFDYISWIFSLFKDPKKVFIGHWLH